MSKNWGWGTHVPTHPYHSISFHIYCLSLILRMWLGGLRCLLCLCRPLFCLQDTPSTSVRYRMQNGSGDCKTCSYGPQESCNARPLRYRTIQLRAQHFDTWSYRHTDTSHLQITATLKFGYLWLVQRVETSH